MSSSEKSFEYFDQLSQLLSALCEGELSQEDAIRLRQMLVQWPQARRYFLEYMELHAELHWATGPGQQTEEATPVFMPECPLGLDMPIPWTSRLQKAVYPWRWILVGAGILAALSLGLVLAWSLWKPGSGSGQSPGRFVAQWGETSLPQWADSSAKPDTHPQLAPGQTIELKSGFVEVRFPPQIRAILEGPGRLEVLEGQTAKLHWGRLAVYVPPDPSTISLQTPSFLLEGKDTQFGVVVLPKGGEQVHVFSGRLAIRPHQENLTMILRTEENPSEPLKTDRPGKRIVWLEAGQAVQSLPQGEKTTNRIELIEIFPDISGFVYRLPGEPWAARIPSFRAAVARHPALLHHYPFEGATAEQRRQDQRGQLHLVEVVMSGGRGESAARFVHAPAGAGQWAFHPARGFYAGNTIGSALQTEGVFHPPANLTLELLIFFAGFPPRQRDSIGTLLTTRADARRVSIFLAVEAEGHLFHLFEADSPGEETDVDLIPGEWYYLASTFQADLEKQTTVCNTYLANLTRGENTLQWVVQNKVLVGIPASSRLGIGKGFDSQGAHAYPWAGLMDEIAIYGSVLDIQTLQTHLDILMGRSASNGSENKERNKKR